tara:strand:- start:343 stop:738 length:396 start_codon:yes stop_codon:yes gene_type:complete
MDPFDITRPPLLYEPDYKDGDYIDKIPFDFLTGIKCPCSSYKDVVFKNRSSLKQHFKSKNHEKWINILNENRVNYYSQCLEQQKTLKNQTIIINKKDAEIRNLQYEIIRIKEQLNTPSAGNIDLLDLCDFD